MMDGPVLATWVTNHYPIELVDIRSRNEFAAVHIPGARSLPFGELAAPRIFRRLRPTGQPVCIISADGHARASLATGILRSAGYVNVIPLDGGMRNWIACDFPVCRKRLSAKTRAYLAARAAVTVITAAAAAALRELKRATLFLAISKPVNRLVMHCRSGLR
jgi:rhodanese-related sulfurtransferase